jgi:hypothetical protein
MSTAKPSQTTITQASTFERWWQYRDLPNDQRLKAAAIKAGLVTNAGGLLWLTEAGKELRRAGEAYRAIKRARHVHA